MEDVGGSECNVTVAVRFRPTNPQEASKTGPSSSPDFLLDLATPNTVRLRTSARENTFSFDRVFPPTAPQELVYTEVARGAVDDVLRGYNATIFAYGQTGSGKTFTMMGRPGDEGIIPRVAKQLFDRIRTGKDDIE